MEAYDDNKDGKIEIREVRQLFDFMIFYTLFHFLLLNVPTKKFLKVRKVIESFSYLNYYFMSVMI